MKGLLWWRRPKDKDPSGDGGSEWFSWKFVMEMSASCGLAMSLFRLYCLWIYSVLCELRGKQPFRITLRRICILWILAIALPALSVWNHVGFWLDDYVFPAWKDTKVENPVFLVGNARSGTTWLHRLLFDCKGGSFCGSTVSGSASSTKDSASADSSKSSPNNSVRFTTFCTWEILFAVPVIWKVFFHSLYGIDQTIFRGFFFHQLMRLDRALVGHITVHPVGLMEAEEDEWLMMHIGWAQLLFFFYPAASEGGNPLIFFDYHPDMMPDILAACQGGDSLAKSGMDPLKLGIAAFHKKVLQYDRRKLLPLNIRLMIFQYYHQCVQRHLYFQQLRHSVHAYNVHSSSQKIAWIFLSKNPAFTLRIESLYATFPSAKVVCLLRDPVQSVPSMVSYISCVWHAFSSPSQAYPEARRLLGFCEAHYLYPLMHLHESLRDKSSFAFVSYHHLSRDLTRVMTQELLPRLFPSPPELLKELADDAATTAYFQKEERKSKQFQSSHEYNFVSCCEGVSVVELQRSLHVVYRVHQGYFPSRPMQ
jgi:hypothetical protein